MAMSINSLLKMNKQNCLVTGALGNLGRQIVEVLPTGTNIVALDLKESLDQNYINLIKKNMLALIFIL